MLYIRVRCNQMMMMVRVDDDTDVYLTDGGYGVDDESEDHCDAF
jgi:hypothetical protein